MDNLCDMDMVNKVGQTAFDVADEDILGYLEELQKKQNLVCLKTVKKLSVLVNSLNSFEFQTVKKSILVMFVPFGFKLFLGVTLNDSDQQIKE